MWYYARSWYVRVRVVQADSGSDSDSESWRQSVHRMSFVGGAIQTVWVRRFTGMISSFLFRLSESESEPESACTTRVPLRWVHTCNLTAYRNAVTLQDTDTIRSYELNFHPVPHGVTVSCERYTLAFPVSYGSSRRWWRVTLPVHTCSGRNRTIPLMQRPNTASTPNKPVT